MYSFEHVRDAEQSLLGAIMAHNKAFGTVADFLRPEHFYEPVHQRIYQVAVDLVHARDDPFDLRVDLGPGGHRPADVFDDRIGCLGGRRRVGRRGRRFGLRGRLPLLAHGRMLASHKVA